MERLAIAMATGAFGFGIGLFAWWCVPAMAGIGGSTFLLLSLGLGVICFLLGFWCPEQTVDVLGEAGAILASLRREVFRWFR